MKPTPTKVLIALAVAMFSYGYADETKDTKPTEPGTASKGTDTKPTMEVISVEPASPAVLKTGEKLKVKIRYRYSGQKLAFIFPLPSYKGQMGSYSCSPSGDLHPPGGEIEWWVSCEFKSEIDELRISMVEETGKKIKGPDGEELDETAELAELRYPIKAQWNGPVFTPDDPVAPIGRPFPGLKFRSLQGEEVDVSKMKGRVVLVDFWATWCGPCCAAIPHIAELYAKHHEKGLDVVCVSLDTDKEALEAYIQKHKLPWSQAFDGKGWEGELARKFSVKGIPHSYLIDVKGVVRKVGARGAELAEAVEELMKEVNR